MAHSIASQVYCGVELDNEAGGGDGSVLDVEYFRCDPGKGVFVTPKRLKFDDDTPQEEPPQQPHTTAHISTAAAPSPHEENHQEVEAASIADSNSHVRDNHAAYNSRGGGTVAASPGAAAGADDDDGSVEPDWSAVEPSDEDLQHALAEIQHDFLIASGDEKSIAHARRMKELSVCPYLPLVSCVSSSTLLSFSVVVSCFVGIFHAHW